MVTAKTAKRTGAKATARNKPAAKTAFSGNPAHLKSAAPKATPAVTVKKAVKKAIVKAVVKKAALSGQTSAADALSDAGATLKQRLAALVRLGPDVTGSKRSFESVCKLLRDGSGNPQLRNSALMALQAAAFDPVAFAKYRATYLAVLRELRGDADPELRQRAFGLLAREQDADTQALLLDGLENPARALLPPEKALQLLSYDPHAGAYAVARKIEKQPPNALARREALRVLAADGNSVDLFEGVLKDKKESMELRQIAASALNHLAPRRMQQCARLIAMDDSDSDDARAVGLTALSQFGEESALASDATLMKKVETLGQNTADAGLRTAVLSFKGRYS